MSAAVLPPPRRPAEGFGRALAPYTRALRSHPVLVGLILLAAVLGALLGIMRREPDYEATGQFVIAPLAQGDEAYIGLPLIRDSGDPTRTAQTAASLLESGAAAVVAARGLGPSWTSAEVSRAITIAPEGESNILSVTARASSGRAAARLANQYALAVLGTRRAALRRLARKRIEQTRFTLAAQPAGSPLAPELSRRLAQLQTVADGDDPTVSISQLATTPSAPIGPPSWLVLALTIGAGCVLATAAAVLLDAVTPGRIADEEQLLELYPLPVLARIPRLRSGPRRSGGRGPLVSPLIREAFRTLQVELELSGRRSRSIMFASASPRDGKTTAIVNFGFELASAGKDVILLDLDFRKPELTSALGVTAEHRLDQLLLADRSLEDALVPVRGTNALRIVPATRRTHPAGADLLAERFPALLAEGRRIADYVLIDSPPLSAVSDALKFAGCVDDLLVVVRLGSTRRAAFEVMRDTLARATRDPTGLLVVGDQGRTLGYPYGYAAERDGEGRGLAPRPRLAAPDRPA